MCASDSKARTARLEREESDGREATAALLREAADALVSDRPGTAMARLRQVQGRLDRIRRARAALWRARLIDEGRYDLAERMTGDSLADMDIDEVDHLGAVLRARALNGVGIVVAPNAAGEPPRSA